MPFDPTAYLQHVDTLDMAQSRKLELICIVATVMENFVDRAFGVAPEQILLGTSGTRSTQESANALDSTITIKATFRQAAREDAAKESEE